MSKKSAIIKTIIFVVIVLLTAAGVLVSALLPTDFHTYNASETTESDSTAEKSEATSADVSSSEDDNPVQDGVYYFDGTDVYTYSVNFTGKWEFYPDTLLCSEGKDPSDQYMELVNVPDRWIGNAGHTLPESGNASYRLVIENFEAFAGHSNVVLSFSGFMGDFQLFINGEPASVRIPTPTGYPIYSIDEEGTVEIVVELKGSSTGLTIAPEIWAIGVHIGNMDSTRSFLLVIFTLFAILFVMFIVFSFSQESHKLRPLGVTGLLMTLLFAADSVWASGYQDTINTVLSNEVISSICLIVRMILLGYSLFIFRRFYPTVMTKKKMAFCECLLGAAFINYFICVTAIHWANGWIITYALIILTLLIWAVSMAIGMFKNRVDCLENSIVYMILYGAAALSFIFDWQPDKKLLMLGFPVSLVCLIVLCFINYYRYQHEALIRTRELLEIERYVNRTKTAMLSSQIQPHFLYNTLLTIQELCRFDPAEASRVIVRFSDYLRHNIDFMNYSELTPFEAEEKHIDNFMYIQEIRFQDKLNYTSDIQTRNFQIPPLTVQPLLENAIKYGVRSRLEGGFVNLSVYEDISGIHIVVRNSGDGFDPDKIRDDHSIGNIRTRLKTILNAYLTIKSQEGKEGSVVEIFIPASEIVRSNT